MDVDICFYEICQMPSSTSGSVRKLHLNRGDWRILSSIPRWLSIKNPLFSTSGIQTLYPDSRDQVFARVSLSESWIDTLYHGQHFQAETLHCYTISLRNQSLVPEFCSQSFLTSPFWVLAGALHPVYFTSLAVLQWGSQCTTHPSSPENVCWCGGR